MPSVSNPADPWAVVKTEPDAAPAAPSAADPWAVAKTEPDTAAPPAAPAPPAVHPALAGLPTPGEAVDNAQLNAQQVIDRLTQVGEQMRQNAIPRALRGYTPQELQQPGAFTNPRTGQRSTLGGDLAQVPILDSPTAGVSQIGQGVEQMAQPDSAEKWRGAGKVFLGGMQTASPVFAGLGVTAPVDAAAWYAMSKGLSGLGEAGGKASGMNDEDAQETGEVAGSLPILYGAKEIAEGKLSDAIDRHNAIADKLIKADVDAARVAGAEGIDVAGTDGWTIKGVSGEKGGIGYVVRDASGKTLFGGSPADVTSFLESKGVQRTKATLPTEPEPETKPEDQPPPDKTDVAQPVGPNPLKVGDRVMQGASDAVLGRGVDSEGKPLPDLPAVTGTPGTVTKLHGDEFTRVAGFDGTERVVPTSTLRPASVDEFTRGHQEIADNLDTQIDKLQADLKNAKEYNLGKKKIADLRDYLAAAKQQKEAITSKLGELKGEGPELKPPPAPRPTDDEMNTELPERAPSVEPAYGRDVDIHVAGEDTVYPAQYAVYEGADVHPSHDPFSFKDHPPFAPLTNDRDYSTDENKGRLVNASAPGKFKASTVIAPSTTAELGSPIQERSGGRLLSGNFRSEATKRMYANDPAGAAAYRKRLADEAISFGIDPAQLTRFKNPEFTRVLKGTLTQAMAQRAITDFNKSSSASLAPEEQAVSDGRRISAQTIAHIAHNLGDVGPDATLAESLKGEGGTRIVDGLVSDGVLTVGQRNAYINDKGELTGTAKDRIGKALVGRLYNSSAEMRETPPAIRGTLERIAPHLLRVEDRPEWNIVQQTREAVAALADAKAHGILNLDDLAAQKDIHGQTRSYSPEVLAIAKTLQQSKDAAKAFRFYAKDSDASRDGAQVHFLEPPTQPEAFAAAFGLPEAEQTKVSTPENGSAVQAAEKKEATNDNRNSVPLDGVGTTGRQEPETPANKSTESAESAQGTESTGSAEHGRESAPRVDEGTRSDASPSTEKEVLGDKPERKAPEQPSQTERKVEAENKRDDEEPADHKAAKEAEAAIPDHVAPAVARDPRTGRRWPVAYLTGVHNPKVLAAAEKRGDIGLMVTPLVTHFLHHAEHYPVIAIDNGVFSKSTPFDPDKFLALVKAVAARPELAQKVRFAVAPDVVGDAAATIERFDGWADKIHALGLPVAFAAQDGLENMADSIPWHKMDVLFIGGSTEWKIGTHAKAGSPEEMAWIKIFKEANKRGIPIHMGRVNSLERLHTAEYGLGASTVDGTYLAFAPDKNLPNLTNWLDKQNKREDLGEKRVSVKQDDKAPDTGRPDETDNSDKLPEAPKGWGQVEPLAHERHPSVDLSDEELTKRAKNAPLPMPPGAGTNLQDAWDIVSRIVPELARRVKAVSRSLPKDAAEHATVNPQSGVIRTKKDETVTAETLWHELIHLDQPDALKGRHALTPDRFNELEMQARVGIADALKRFEKIDQAQSLNRAPEPKPESASENKPAVQTKTETPALKPEQTGNGKWHIGGMLKIPAHLHLVRKDGSPATDEDIASAKISGPGFVGLKPRLFDTREEAQAALDAYHASVAPAASTPAAKTTPEAKPERQPDRVPIVDERMERTHSQLARNAAAALADRIKELETHRENQGFGTSAEKAILHLLDKRLAEAKELQEKLKHASEESRRELGRQILNAGHAQQADGKLQQIAELAAALIPHANGQNTDTAERKQLVSAALDLKVGKRAGESIGKLTPEEDAFWESEIRPQLDGIIKTVNSNHQPKVITDQTPLDQMSVAEFRQARPAEATRLPANFPVYWHRGNWQEDGLLELSNKQLEAILTLNGLAVSGTKRELVTRMIRYQDLYKRYAGMTQEQLAALPLKEVDSVLDQLGGGKYGSRKVKAVTILNQFLKNQGEGAYKLAEFNYDRLREAEGAQPTPAATKTEKPESTDAVKPALAEPTPAAPTPSAEDEVKKILGRRPVSEFSLPELFAASEAHTYKELNEALVRLIKGGGVKRIAMKDGGTGFQRVLTRQDIKTSADVQALEPAGSSAGEPVPTTPATKGTSAEPASGPTIEAHGSGGTESSGTQGAGRSGDDAVRSVRPEALAGVPPEDVRGPEEAEPSLPVRAGGVGDDAGADADAALRTEETPVRPGGGDRLPGVVSPSRGVHSSAPDVRSSPASTANLAGDFRLTPEEAASIEAGGAKTKARANLAAIRTIKQIIAEGNRAATLEEQRTIAKYTGWGSGELAQGIFKNQPDWRGIREDLKTLLTPEEWDAAEQSTLNAHYTRRDVAAAMWEAARRMGFQAGGSVIEPGMGIGNFFMMMPEDLQPGSSRTGVEMDLLTGAMAKALFPGSNIVVKPYQKTNLPDGYFDFAIGNVPFAKHMVVDPAFKRQPYLTNNVHNYFFAKSIEKLRPGGVMLAITSRYTMDGQDTAFRRWMNERAELLGAIRLPADTFKANAGTSVTVDIIALRKRVEGAIPVSDNAWIQSPKFTMEGGEDLNLNEYFQAHPEMMMGQMMPGKQYVRGYPELIGKFSLDKLNELLGQLPAAVIPAWSAGHTGATDALVENYPDAAHIKDQQFGLVNGAVVQRDKGYFKPVPLKGKKLDRMKGLIGLRGVTREVIRSQRLDLPEAEILDARKELNRAYNSFVKQHGPVNSAGNAQVFADDPDWPVLAGLLEDYDGRAYANVPKEAKDKGGWEVTPKGEVQLRHAGKSYTIARTRPVFRERTIQKPQRVEHADTGAEALAVSLSDVARIDWDRMQELTGRDPEALQRELAGHIFRNPVSRQWETADEYLSGNVRQKLRDAEFMAADHPEFEPNVAALKAVQPPDKEPGNGPGQIKAALGAIWIPDTDYSEFGEEVLHIERARDAHNNVREQLVRFVPQTGGYGLRPSYSFQDAGVANTTEYGTPYFSGIELFEMALNGRAPVAKDTYTDMDGIERSVKNPDATIAAVEKQDKLRDAFIHWLWKDPERSQRLAAKYNEELNNLRQREYDGSHLTFPGLNKSWLRGGEPEPHQKSAVWRTLQSGNTLYAHVVGAGKTLEAIMAAMELRRLGMAKKPMMVVPNHLVGQWRDDWMRAYPGAQILVPTKKDFEKQNRQKLMSRIAGGNYDGVIVGHASFGKIGVKDETYQAFVDSQLKEIEDALDVAREGLGKKDEFKDPTIKQLRRRKAQLEARLEKRSKRDEKDTSLTFEELGVDQLFVDEADLFKNLGYMTMMDRIAGLPNSDSDRATDMLLKTQYVGNLRGGDRGVVFMTGTPVSNSIAEVWTMMRYLQPRYLEQQGFDQFDSWAKTFGRTRTQMEVAPEGGRFIQRTRFSKFQNAGQMMAMFRLIADIKTKSQLNLPTPAIYKGGYVDVVAPATPELKDYVQQIGERADAVRKGEVKPEEDNMLKISSDGRKASLDMRLVRPSLPDHPDSKPNLAVKQIAEVYREFGEHKGTQIVFLDLSTPKSEKSKRKKPAASEEVANTDEAAEDLYGGQPEGDEEEEADTAEEAREIFTVYSEIKKKLAALGIPPDEIAFMQDAKTDAQKQSIFDRMNAGQLRVLLGSTEKMGAGTNVQQKLVALHHLDAPWRPRDMAQRDGRIDRQGNRLYDAGLIKNVRLYRYMTEGSFDAFMWETLASKAAPIEQLMEGDPNMDDVEELSPLVLSYEQAKAISSGNPLIREKIILDQDIHKLNVSRSSWLSDQSQIALQLAAVPATISGLKEGVAKLEADIATRDAHPGLTVDGETFEGKQVRAEGAPALFQLLEKLGTPDHIVALPATYRGFALAAVPQQTSLEARTEQTANPETFVRTKEGDKWLYYKTAPGANVYGTQQVADLGLTPLKQDKAQQVHALWGATGNKDKAWLGGSDRIHVYARPDLRLASQSGVYAISTNYENPSGTIQSLEWQVQFEEQLKQKRDDLRRNEKKLNELESKSGAPFDKQEQLDKLRRRAAELSMLLGEDGDDKQALRASEEGDEANPLTPYLKDPDAAMHAKWFPQRKYFGAAEGNQKLDLKGNVVTPELAVRKTKDGYNVDHIPTGRVLVKDMARDFDAVALARQAAKKFDLNWTTPPEGFAAKFQKWRKEEFKPATETPEQTRHRFKNKLDDFGNFVTRDEGEGLASPFYVKRGEGESPGSLDARPLHSASDLMPYRDRVYHATTLAGLKGILADGQITTGHDRGEESGVSVSRVPQIKSTFSASGGPKAVTLVVDHAQLPSARPKVETGSFNVHDYQSWKKTIRDSSEADLPESTRTDIHAQREAAREAWLGANGRLIRLRTQKRAGKPRDWVDEEPSEEEHALWREADEADNRYAQLTDSLFRKMNPRFEFELRTHNKPVPLSAVKGILLNREALEDGAVRAGIPEQDRPAYVEQQAKEIRSLAARHGLPVREYGSGRDMFSDRARLATLPADALFQRSLKPVTAQDSEGMLAQSDAEFVPSKVRGQGRLYVNAPAMDLIAQISAAVQDQAHNSSAPIPYGATYDERVAEAVADGLDELAGEFPALRRLASEFRRALADGAEVIVANASDEATLTRVKETLRHEGIHRAQMRLAQDAGVSLYGLVDADELALNDNARAGMDALLPTYGRNVNLLAVELPAWIASGSYRQLRLSRDQALDALAHTFDLLFMKFGDKALRMLTQVQPELRKDLLDHLRQSEPHRGAHPRQPQAGDSTAGHRQRPGARSARPDETGAPGAQLPQGREKGAGEDVRRSGSDAAVDRALYARKKKAVPTAPSPDWQIRYRRKIEDLYAAFRAAQAAADQAWFGNPDSAGPGVVSPTFQQALAPYKVGAYFDGMKRLEKQEAAHKAWNHEYGAKADALGQELMDWANGARGKRAKFTSPDSAYRFLREQNPIVDADGVVYAKPLASAADGFSDESLSRSRNKLAQADDEGKKNFSGLGEWESATRRNLGQLRRASPDAWESAVQTASSKSQAAVLISTAFPKIDQALAGRFSLNDFQRAMIQSRLHGIEDRWRGLAEQSLRASDANLAKSSERLIPLLGTLEDRQGFYRNLGQTAASLLNKKDFGSLRALLADAFTQAADSVNQSIMPAPEFAATTAAPQFRAALGVYKRLVEPQLAESHESNEGVFSDALGPLDTYYPLIPVEDEDVKRLRNASKLEYARPKNILNDFATGLSKDYDASMEAFRDRMGRAIKVNNKAAMIDTLVDYGLAVPLKPHEKAGDVVRYRGENYAAVALDTTPPRVIVENGKATHLPAHRILIPKWLHAELEPVLQNKYKPTIGWLGKIMNSAAAVAISGPVDAVFHSSNLFGTLVANTPFLGNSILGKAASIPVIKRFAAIAMVLATDPATEENAAHLQAMSKLGVLPDRFGSETYSRKYAEITGSHLKTWHGIPYSAGPVLFGPKGIDVRARLLMYRIAKEINPDIEGPELHLVVNQLGIYADALQAKMVRGGRRAGATFIVAGNTMRMNGINAVLGTGPMPKKGLALRIWQMLTGGLLGTLALWILIHKAYTGRYPWQDSRMKLLQIPANQDDRYSTLGRHLWGNGPETGYLNFNFFNPILGRGLHATGLDHGVNTAANGGAWWQAFEAAQTDVMNSFAHPFLGPLPRAAFVGLTGDETYLTGLRNDRGDLNPQFMPAVRKAGGGSSIARRGLAAAGELNPFFANVGANAGLGQAPQANDSTDHWLKMAADLALPGLVAHPQNPDAQHSRLLRQAAVVERQSRQR